jgi:hypothetical protein
MAGFFSELLMAGGASKGWTVAPVITLLIARFWFTLYMNEWPASLDA